jgi:hypothetical protein
LLHEHGSNNPNGVTSNGDRYAMHPYFIFKDLVTIFAFFLVLSVLVFFYPNLLGLQNLSWPKVILLIVSIIFICAICWKNIINYINLLSLIKIHNKTLIVSGLFIIVILRKYIIDNINPVIVKYYYEIFNQQITKILNNFSNYIIYINYLYFNYNDCCLLLVGISETLRTQTNNIIKPSVALVKRVIIIKTRKLAPYAKSAPYAKGKGQHCDLWEGKGEANEIKFIKSNNINHSCITNKNLIYDNHNKEISLKFKQ